MIYCKINIEKRIKLLGVSDLRFVITFIWAFLLTQMINFILNSLSGGGQLYPEIGLLFAVLITLVVFFLDVFMKPRHNYTEDKQ